MNHAWHARRAKREIRRGGNITEMPHTRHLRYSYGVRLWYAQGYELQIVLNNEDQEKADG